MADEVEVGYGNFNAVETERGIAGTRGNDAFGMIDAGGVKEQAVYNAENSGVRANAKREREDGDSGEARRFGKQAECVLQVLAKRIHGASCKSEASARAFSAPREPVVEDTRAGGRKFSTKFSTKFGTKFSGKPGGQVRLGSGAVTWWTWFSTA